MMGDKKTIWIFSESKHYGHFVLTRDGNIFCQTCNEFFSKYDYAEVKDED